ncbi:MAG: hypothetical protein IJM59_09000 [Proteobacteria bacterium]|nr:hypothetical protein [Pseudomonadota bacterium]
MKKLTWLFAALSICACSFTACGDDDSGDSKAKENESCAEATCDDGLVCNETSKICEKAKAAKGESCAEAACADGLVCNETSKICEDAPAPAKAKKGESCEKAECEAGLVCGDDKKCAEAAAPAAKAKKGESCETLACEDNLVCGDDKICAEPAAPAKAKKGESCETLACEDNLVCGDDKICAEAAPADKAKEGESCETLECDENLKCNDDKICEAAKQDIDCDALTDVKSAFDAMVALSEDDLKDCSKVEPASKAVADAVAAASLEFDAVEAACFEGWGVAADKKEAIDAAVASCSPVEVKCEEMSNVKTAVEAVAALTEDDLKDCDKLAKAMNDDLDAAMVSDKVYAADASDDDKDAAAEIVLKACAEGWGMTSDKQTAVNAAVDACNALAVCKEKAAGDSCGDKMVCTQDGENLVCKAQAAEEDPCKGKKENDECGENKICDKDLKCVDKKAEEEDPCKGKKENDACGENKVCDKDLKCVDKKAAEGESCEKLACEDGLACNSDKKCAKAKEGESCDKGIKCVDGLACNSDKKCAKAKEGESCDNGITCEEDLICGKESKKCEIDCSKKVALSAAMTKIVAYSAEDLKNCATIAIILTAMDEAMIADKIYDKEDKPEDQEAKGNAILKACGETWGMTTEKATELDDATEACIPIFACMGEDAELGKECGEKMTCQLVETQLRCVGEKDAACDEINVCKADLVCDANTKKCTEASAE